MKKTAAIFISVLLMLSSIPAMAESLAEAVKIGEVRYKNPNIIELTEDEKSITLNPVVSVCSDKAEEGEIISSLTDLLKTPVFVPTESCVRYDLAEMTEVSGIRMIKDSLCVGNIKANIYGSENGEDWYYIGGLFGKGTGTLLTDFGYNTRLKCLVVEFSDTTDIRLSEMHILGKRKGESVALHDIENTRLYKNGTDTKDFKITSDAEMKSTPSSNMLDGNVDTFWHSAYTVVDGKAVPVKALPHTITISFNKEITTSGVRTIPRNGASKITKAEVYGSSDGKSFYKISEGKFTYTSNEDTAPRDILFGKNLKLTALRLVITEAGGGPYSTCAELEIFKRNMAFEEAKLDELTNDSWEVTASGNVVAAFDGIDNTVWETDENPELTIDFGKTTSVSGIRCYTEETEIQSTDVYISSDGESFKKLVNADLSLDNEYHFNCNIALRAIKLDVKRINGKFKINEVAVLSKTQSCNDINPFAEITRGTWTVTASSEAGYAPATRMLDGDINTFWHSYHDASGHDAPPIDYIVDFGSEIELSGFNYYPRRDNLTGYVKALDVYISVEDKDGEPVWDLVKSDKYTYLSNYAIQKTEFDVNYTAKKIKLHITEGNAGYVTGAELCFLEAVDAKRPKSAQLLSSTLTYDPENPMDIEIPIKYNDAGRIVSFKNNGTPISSDYYSVTDSGITLSYYYFIDFVNDMTAHNELFTVDFLLGNDLNAQIKIGEGARYKIEYATEGGGVLEASVKANTFTSGDTVKTGEVITLTAKPDSGYAVSEWKITGGTLEGAVTYSGNTKEEYVAKNPTADITVIAVFTRLSGSANVNCDIKNAQSNITQTTAKGENAVWQLSTSGKYNLPESITVLKNGLPLKAGLDYSYERIADSNGIYSSGALSIYNVSGDLAISLSAYDNSERKVIYRDEFGAIGDVPAVTIASVGDVVTVEKCKMNLSGYKFKGWKSSFNRIIYDAGDTFTMPDAEVTLTSVWEKSEIKGGGNSGGSGNGIAVTFVGGAESGIPTVTINGITTKVARKYIVPAPAVRDGYEFMGYCLDEALTVPYKNDGVTASITLYESWRRARNRLELTDILGHWAENYIGELYEDYVVNGGESGTFLPDDEITRAEFVQILYNMSGMKSDGSSEFKDVHADDWFMPAVVWAVKYEITEGAGDNTFLPYEKITREQMAAMLYRYNVFSGGDWKVSTNESFNDEADIADYAKYQVRWAKEKGVITGDEYGSFAPKKNATRAEAATMLARLRWQLNIPKTEE